MYEIRFRSPRAERELLRLPARDRNRIRSRLDLLKLNPRPPGIKALEPGVYRLRVGNYRVVYQVIDAEHIIIIGLIGPRNEDTYSRWRDLF